MHMILKGVASLRKVITSQLEIAKDNWCGNYIVKTICKKHWTNYEPNGVILFLANIIKHCMLIGQ
jgi:hypothetical protein